MCNVTYNNINLIETFVLQNMWIRTNGFKGAMILSLNVDDWNGTCYGTNETFPLTRTISKVLFKESDK